MTNDIDDHKTIGRNFSMLSNLLALQTREERQTRLQSASGPERMRAFMDLGTAREITDAYTVKFLASGAHLKPAPNSHALPDDVQRAAEPLEGFLDGQYRLRTGYPPDPAQRKQMLDFLDRSTVDKTLGQFRDEWNKGNAYPAPADVHRLNEILPKHVDTWLPALLRQRETGDPLAAQRLQAQVSKQTVPQEERKRSMLDENDFHELPAMIENVRTKINRHLARGEPLFDPRHNPHVDRHDPAAHGPQFDMDAAKVNGIVRLQAMDNLKQEIIAARDPLIEETARRITGRASTDCPLAKALTGPDASLSSSITSDGSISPPALKRPRLDERPRDEAFSR